MKRAKRPRVSIIIPAYNEADYIKSCLESCLSQYELPDEIIVVDNRSDDKTVEIIERLQANHANGKLVRLVHQTTEQGLVPTRNAGFAAATGDVFGRIDADSTLDPDWTRIVKDLFTDDVVDAATGPVVYHDMPAKKLGLLGDNFIRKKLANYAQEYAFLFGSNMAIRADAWRTIESQVCLDEADEMHEDIDIALHLFSANKQIFYTPKMIGGMSARRLSDSPPAFYRYIMRYERTYQRHDIKNYSARIPIVIYLLLYFPLKSLYKIYNAQSPSAMLRQKINFRRSI